MERTPDSLISVEVITCEDMKNRVDQKIEKKHPYDLNEVMDLLHELQKRLADVFADEENLTDCVSTKASHSRKVNERVISFFKGLGYNANFVRQTYINKIVISW